MNDSAELVLEFTVGRDGAWQIGHYCIFLDGMEFPFDFPKAKTRRRAILKKLLDPLIWHIELCHCNLIIFKAKIDSATADLILRLTDTKRTPARWLRDIDPNADPETVKLELNMVFLARNLK